MMTMPEATAAAGLSTYTLRACARRGEFLAWLPRGKRGGYVIDPDSFRCWLLRRKMQTGNAPARAMAERQLAQLNSL